MRIISGFLKGQRFDLPNPNWKTRPTTDQAKESLFNILFNKIDLEGIEVLDLFSGTGNLAYEFASRGAKKVVCVEKFNPCTNYIRQNAKKFNIENILSVHKQDVFKFLRFHHDQYNIIFADPPYDSQKIQLISELVFNKNLLKTNGLLIIEHDSRQNFANHPNFIDLRQYGQSCFSFIEQQ
ncbi:MAG: 16S rRNA (guanine(966)-N(2))-methyltransferase RsmD [Saprospiraceae bacterium]|nr:16S rRNA (guanine(966)-N(2))-methyltransferase RsmD [Saprospiraceae bacterium]